MVPISKIMPIFNQIMAIFNNIMGKILISNYLINNNKQFSNQIIVYSTNLMIYLIKINQQEIILVVIFKVTIIMLNQVQKLQMITYILENKQAKLQVEISELNLRKVYVALLVLLLNNIKIPSNNFIQVIFRNQRDIFKTAVVAVVVSCVNYVDY